MENLLELLKMKGGSVVSTAKLSEIEIQEAREKDRMYVDEYGFGFAWIEDKK